MRLGYAGHSARVFLLLTSFNEAEAHAPRILIDISSKTSKSFSFNEAEAHAPRIRFTD